ncbi:unnamed protein product, partial [Heterosigma akashiwo]
PAPNTSSAYDYSTTWVPDRKLGTFGQPISATMLEREDKRKVAVDNLPTGARTDDLVLQNPARYCLSHAVPSTRPDYLSNINQHFESSHTSYKHPLSKVILKEAPRPPAIA